MKVHHYWQKRQPLWVRGVITGLGAFVVWFFCSGNRHESVAFRAISSFLYAVLLAVALTLQARRLQARRFGDATADERVEMLRAIDAGRLPDDGRLRDRTVNLARWQLRRANSPGLTVGVMVFIFAMCVACAILGWGAGMWVLAALFAVIAPLGLIRLFRQRKGARRLLESVPVA